MEKKRRFIQLIKEHEGLIFKITKVYAVDEEDQKDLYQEVVYQLWKAFDSFEGRAKISTWMYRIALNTAITHVKKEKKKGLTTTLDSQLHELVYEANQELEEQIQLLYAQIKKLNVIEKSIVLLYLEGKTYEEIALITGFSKTNIGTRLARIKQKLKAQIKTIWN